ncbi:serine/threonine-protein kinase [Streptomyces sp. WI04-05B]|uniref:serine/threonine-protein kinase n=1 Tax=Streptomyces TaxID=1883 RepID=UPI0029AC18DB|nr:MULTISPECIES: serine/threonine-protein kinase [unclassified Streptomyces]MDX2543914.1 serine/threonine-protein kinase [Streptomyces sp. WI04-05B]MDX2584376.1 serine/threonine-protein kinase [Streptomyces sp. WI04-05A]
MSYGGEGGANRGGGNGGRDGGNKGDVGRLVGGRYRLTERIGSGGMGTVWRAQDELVEREVAVKQPRLPGDPQDAAHQRTAHRLHREARAAARVDHPSAVSVHDVVVEDGLPWIVMELVRGESLHEVLQRGPVKPAESARIGLAVVGALSAAHSVGIVHRDVKPANVLLGPHGRVVLTDFGIAHIMGEESLTMSGEFVGSLEFIAPERMSGRGAGPSSDLWSLGVLLYAAVEGWSPFRRTTLESTLAAILAADPVKPQQAGPLGPLLVRLLVKDPAERPDADEVTAALEAVAKGWPLPKAAERGELTKAQEASGIRELAEDAGTVRLKAEGRAPESDPEPPPPASPTSTPTPSPSASGSGPGTVVPGGAVPGAPGTGASPETRAVSLSAPKASRRGRSRRVILGVLGGAVALVAVGAVVEGVVVRTGGEDAAVAVEEPGGTPEAVPPVPVPPTEAEPTLDGWTAHDEKDLRAVLALPRQYVRFHEQGDAGDQPRMAIYDNDAVIQVRLTLWDKAPRSPLGQAKEAADTWAGYGESTTRYTDTTVGGYKSVQADTTYDTEGRLVRVMQVEILTDDGRLYELRVDMPKGTPDEKRGTDVFKEARDRLQIDRA